MTRSACHALAIALLVPALSLAMLSARSAPAGASDAKPAATPGGSTPAPAAAPPPGATPAGSATAAPAAPEKPADDPEALRAVDCGFVETAFARMNQQLNERAVNPTNETIPLLSIFADLQRNLILMHQGRGCDPAKLVAIIRTEGTPKNGAARAQSAPPPPPSSAAATPAAPPTPAAAPAGAMPETLAEAPELPVAPVAQPPRREAPRPQPKIEIEKLREPLVVKRSVNVRALPDQKSERLATIQAGGAAVVGKVRGRDWYLVEGQGGQQGFVYGSFVGPASGSNGGSATASARAEPAAGGSRAVSQGVSAQAAAGQKGAGQTAARASETDLRRAAEGGNAEAQFALGNSFVEKDMFEAVGWWQAAADRGHPGAQYNLGVAFLRGGVLPQDRNKAIDWFRKASASGHPGAKKALESMGQQ